MTRDANLKKAVRRHAEETGQRYTAALTDLEGLGPRMDHEPDAERLLAHLGHHYRIDPIAATRLSVHKTYVFRIDRHDGRPWVARAFPPARPRAGVEGDAAILRFLERQDYPAERLAVDDAVSDFDGSAVLVTRFVEGDPLPAGVAKFAMMGDLLGRLHALPSTMPSAVRVERAVRTQPGGHAASRPAGRTVVPRRGRYEGSARRARAIRAAPRPGHLGRRRRWSSRGPASRKSPPCPRSRRTERTRTGRDQTRKPPDVAPASPISRTRCGARVCGTHAGRTRSASPRPSTPTANMSNRPSDELDRLEAVITSARSTSPVSAGTGRHQRLDIRRVGLHRTPGVLRVDCRRGPSRLSRPVGGTPRFAPSSTPNSAPETPVETVAELSADHRSQRRLRDRRRGGSRDHGRGLVLAARSRGRELIAASVWPSPVPTTGQLAAGSIPFLRVAALARAA